MYSSFRMARNYIDHYRRAHNGRGHGVHSPFVFDFIRNVLHNGKGYAHLPAIEARRRALLHDRRLLDVEDLGAGSRINTGKRKQVGAIAKAALKSPRLAQVLHRCVRHYQPQTIVELGTSLGITTAYLASAAPGRVSTIEGSGAIAAIAREGFEQLGLDNIDLRIGNFDNVLPRLLSAIDTVDLAYIDGNHRYDPTISYFQQLLRVVHPGTILVFDDIHWSEEMERAWSEIKAHEAVAYTVDIFFLGFVFFRQDFRVKQDFAVRY